MLRDAETYSIAERMRRSPVGGDALSRRRGGGLYQTTDYTRALKRCSNSLLHLVHANSLHPLNVIGSCSLSLLLVLDQSIKTEQEKITALFSVQLTP